MCAQVQNGHATIVLVHAGSDEVDTNAPLEFLGVGNGKHLRRHAREREHLRYGLSLRSAGSHLTLKW